MHTANSQPLSCRHCQHYQPEGRRGGHCHQLNVQVQGAWNACHLMILPFAPSWETAPKELVQPIGTDILVEVALSPAPVVEVGQELLEVIAEGETHSYRSLVTATELISTQKLEDLYNASC